MDGLDLFEGFQLPEASGKSTVGVFKSNDIFDTANLKRQIDPSRDQDGNDIKKVSNS